MLSRHSLEEKARQSGVSVLFPDCRIEPREGGGRNRENKRSTTYSITGVILLCHIPRLQQRHQSCKITNKQTYNNNNKNNALRVSRVQIPPSGLSLILSPSLPLASCQIFTVLSRKMLKRPTKKTMLIFNPDLLKAYAYYCYSTTDYNYISHILQCF